MGRLAGPGGGHRFGDRRGVRGGASAAVAVLGLALVSGAVGAGPAAGTRSETRGGAAAAVATPAAGERRPVPRARGELIVRSTDAWEGVRSFRSVLTVASAATDAPPDAPPTPEPEAGEQVAEVVLPDRARYRFRVEGQVGAEAIAVGGRLWVRGPEFAASAAGAPRARPGGPPLVETIATFPWVEVDVAALDPTDPEQAGLANLAAPPGGAAPLAALPFVARIAPLAAVGPVRVGGRVCDAYRAVVEDPLRGDDGSGGLVVVVALDQDDRPCLVEQRIERIVFRTEYGAYNSDLVIRPPIEGALAPGRGAFGGGRS